MKAVYIWQNGKAPEGTDEKCTREINEYRNKQRSGWLEGVRMPDGYTV